MVSAVQMMVQQHQFQRYFPSERMEVAMLVYIDSHQIGEGGQRPPHGRLEAVAVGSVRLNARAILSAALACVGAACAEQAGVGFESV